MAASRRVPRVLPAAESTSPDAVAPTSRLRRHASTPAAAGTDPSVEAQAPSAPPQPAARSRAEARERYVAARDAWLAAMKAASSGRPADLAALAIKQEAYEAATAELERWESGERVAIPVETDRVASVDAVVEQELAWRRVHQHDEKEPGLLGRLARRLRGR
jgi:hypothetical protein